MLLHRPLVNVGVVDKALYFFPNLGSLVCGLVVLVVFQYPLMCFRCYGLKEVSSWIFFSFMNLVVLISVTNLENLLCRALNHFF